MINIEDVTIIIPVFNCEKYVEKCIGSVLDQTYKNIKIIIVNDGSTDGTIEKIKGIISATNINIKLYNTKNMGISNARNLGIDLCDTKYFMFVDGDDYIEKNTIEILHNEIIKEDCDMVIGSTENLLDNKIILNDNDKYKYLFNYKIKYFETPWNKLYKKSIFKELKYPNINLAEDEYLIHHILKRCHKIVIIPNKTYNYIYNSEGITAKKHIYLNDRIYAMKNRKEFFVNTKYEKNAQKQYMNFLIYVYCEIKKEKIERKYIKNVLKLYKKEEWNLDFKFFLFRFFPIIFYILSKKRKVRK